MVLVTLAVGAVKVRTGESLGEAALAAGRLGRSRWGQMQN